MYRKIGSLILFFTFYHFFSSHDLAQQNRNSISGMVYDASNNRPVSDVYVELLNDVYSTLRRVKTDASGRFYFGNLSSGNFKVKVIPVSTNYVEETKDVELVNFRSGSAATSDSAYIDFYLRLNKRNINVFDQGSPSAVFLQNIPAPAQVLYEKAIKHLSVPNEFELGVDSLKKAIEIFPEYYDAMLRLGVEYANQNKFYEAIPFLVKVVTINERSFLGYYALGISAFNLKQFNEAEKAFQATTILNAQSDYAFIKYGMILRIVGKFKEAELILLKAKTIIKKDSKNELHWQLALLYEKMKRYKDAADELEMFLTIETNPPNLKQIKELISLFRKKASE